MRNSIFISFIILLAAFLGSCNTAGNKIKNDIEINESGLHIEEAYLENSGGQKLGSDNKVQVGDRIYLRLMITGLQQKDGKVFFDALQKTATGSGETLAINPSMFGQVYTTGVPVKDAKQISLYQKIGKLNNSNDHIVITFKVWDKITNKAVSGSYKLYLQ